MNIVFVHFGMRMPTHLELNMKRTVSLFQSHNVYLVTDNLRNLPVIKGLNIVEYRKDSEWNLIQNNLKHPLDFRDGFWVKSIGRFLALNFFMEMFPQPLLHVESDVMLASDFPFHDLIRVKGDAAFPLVSNEQGIASTLFLRNNSISRKLSNFAVKMCTSDMSATDMTVLRSFERAFKSETTILPTGPSSILSPDAQSIPDSVISHELFSGFFDGLDFGYFLFGIDPRNNRGMLLRHRRLNEYFIDANLARFSYNPSREFLDLEIEPNSEKWPIYSLHIHSKLDKVFKSQSSKSYFRRQIDNYAKSPLPKIVPKVFLNSIFDAIRRRLYKRVNIDRS